MRRWVAWLMVFAGASGLSQAGDQAVLERCRLVFQSLRPQFAYAERTAPQRFLLRVVLGSENLPMARITVNVDLIPVPLGLEDIAVVAIERPLQDAMRLRNRLAQGLAGLPQSLSLGNWYVANPAGYRCFLTYQGRVVGVLMLGQSLEPLANPRLLAAYQRAPLRFPPEMP